MTTLARKLSVCASVPFWLSVQSGERRGLKYSLLRAVLAFAAACYSAGLTLYLAAERAGLRRRVRLPVPVISIGNITSGGTGKTPFTQMIAQKLQDQRLRPAILSRGHGGRLSAAPGQVSDSDGNILLVAADAGDEASALARLVPGVPVFVGKKREASARRAIERFHPDLFLLDDGLQYWQLHRNLDIVLLDSQAPFDNGYPLPRGALREPKRNLSRASMVVITRCDLIADDQLRSLEQQISRLAPAAAVFRARHVVSRLIPYGAPAASAKMPRRPLVACGIAQPFAFLSSLEAGEYPVSRERFVALDDHARFTRDELASIRQAILQTNSDSLILTNKDAVKIDAADFAVPVYIAELSIRLENEREFWSELNARAGLPAPKGATVG